MGHFILLSQEARRPLIGPTLTMLGIRIDRKMRHHLRVIAAMSKPARLSARKATCFSHLQPLKQLPEITWNLYFGHGHERGLSLAAVHADECWVTQLIVTADMIGEVIQAID